MKSQILLRGPDGVLADEIEAYNQIDWIPRFRDVGSWSLQAPNTPKALQLGEPGWGIVYKRNDKTIISGPQTLRELKFDANTNTVIASGLSDLVHISDKLVYPSPYPFTADDYDDEGPDDAETLIKYYLSVALADASRRATGTAEILIAPNLNRGTLKSEHGRFQNLLEFIQGLALVGGNLGFDILDNTFDVYEPVDRTAEQVFSIESGSVTSITSKTLAPTCTRVIAAGGGEGTARTFERVIDAALETRWGRVIEAFIDTRDTTDSGIMLARANEALMKGAERTELTIVPRDVPGRTFVDDWYLGDTVADGNGITGVIKEVHGTVNAAGELIQPKVDSSNSAQASATLRAFDAIRRLNTRTLNLERR